MRESELISLFQGTESDFLDDCAELGGGENYLVTTDSMAVGTHFRLDWSSPEDLAVKLYQCNLSDLAASGARPERALLNLGLPGAKTSELHADFPARFARALLSELRADDCALVGGDTYRAPGLVLTLTLWGPIHPGGRRVMRSGGRPGDALYVTGEVGLSLLGYRVLKGESTPPDALRRRALERHLRPRARSEWARILAAHGGVRAMMDLSDGIAQDAERLARASGVELEIDLDALPLPADARDWLSPLDAAISGEEYELLFLGAPDLECSFPVTRIGQARPGDATGTVRFVSDGRVVEPADAGWRHF